MVVFFIYIMPTDIPISRNIVVKEMKRLAIAMIPKSDFANSLVKIVIWSRLTIFLANELAVVHPNPEITLFAIHLSPIINYLVPRKVFLQDIMIVYTHFFQLPIVFNSVIYLL